MGRLIVLGVDVQEGLGNLEVVQSPVAEVVPVNFAAKPASPLGEERHLREREHATGAGTCVIP